MEHLRGLSMKLCIHLLPRADRSSPLVFGILREILATTVFLPIIDKFSNVDWLNGTLLTALKSKNDATPADSEDQGLDLDADSRSATLNRASELEEALDNVKNRLDIFQSKMETIDAEDISTVLEEKIVLQAIQEELQDFVLQEKDASTNDRKYLNISKCALSVSLTNEKESSALTGFIPNSSPNFLFELTHSSGFNWSVEKSCKDIENLDLILKSKIPRLQGHICPAFVKMTTSFSSFLERKPTQEEMVKNVDELLFWFSYLLKDSVACLSVELLDFFLPTHKGITQSASMAFADSVSGLWKSASNSDLTGSIQKALSSAAKPGIDLFQKSSEFNLNKTLSMTDVSDKEPIEAEQIVSSSISQEDLDIILDVSFTAIEELFSLSEGEQWLRQQSLHLIKVVLKRTFSKRLSNAIASKVDAISSQPTATLTLNSLSDTLWPEGRKWGTGPAPVERSSSEIDRTKHQLFCLIMNQEGMKQSKEFENVFSSIKNIVGAQNAQRGLLRGFHLVQNQQLTIGLFCEVLEVLVDMITNA
jgi:hypothetical protein